MTRVKILQTENSRTFILNPGRRSNEPEKFSQFLAATIATLSALSAGMCLSWSSAALPMLQKPDSHLTITKADISWIGSLVTLGAFLGAVPAGNIANRIGRKRTLQVVSVPLFLSWILIAAGGCVYALYAARFLAGLAIGAISVASPMYVAELAHTSIRGTLGTFFQVQITIGLLVEYILGGTLTNFVLIAYVSSVFPLLFLLGFSFMPESPTFLFSKGRQQEARAALQYFRGQDFEVDDELTKLEDDIKQSKGNRASICDLIKCRATVMGMVVSLGLMVFQQLSGINAVLFYAGRIFTETGSTLSPDYCAILVGAVQVVATLLSTLLIDKAGRKILLFISAAIMSVCLLSLGAYFELRTTQDLSHLSILPLISLAVFIIVFSIGLGPIPWMMMGEIFTPESKGFASSVSAAANWLLAFTVTNQFENVINWLGIGMAFIGFGIICVGGAVFVAVFVPETKGKDPEEVKDILLGRKNRKNFSLNFVPRDEDLKGTSQV